MSYLDHIAGLNRWDPAGFIPFYIDRHRVGFLRHAFAKQLANWPDVFQIGSASVALAPHVEGFNQRSDTLQTVLDELSAQGILAYLHGEQYSVTPAGREQALCVVDRAAAPYFGVRAFGQHVSGYVRDGKQLLLWVSRRSADRRHFPSRLDNLAAGGLPHGIGLRGNLEKECWEEAAIPPDLVAAAHCVGALTYCRETEKGLKPDVLYCYDLELPAGFQPRCTDGEVEEFYLWPIEQVAEIVANTDEYKLNCNLVVIDFLMRHGYIEPDHPDYLALSCGLHPTLP